MAVHRDVHQQRHVLFSEASPDRIEVGMRERASFGISVQRLQPVGQICGVVGTGLGADVDAGACDG